MKMYKSSRRDRFYNQGGFYDALCVARIPVVPGQTAKLDVSVKLQTAAFSSNVLCGGIASAFFFYVPNRLVWDDWTDFISQSDGFGGTFPTTTSVMAVVGDRFLNTPAISAFSSLPRRAYKLAFNQFFGSDKNTGAPAWFADITADAVTNTGVVRNTEQFTSRLMVEGALSSPTFDATTVPIDLNDFHRQMVAARSQRKAQMTGDKYVDTLRRMGVEPDWRIQNAPEFLGRVDSDVRPVKTFDTSSTATGESSARYETTLEKSFHGKMFAEHGYIIGLAVLRPHIFNIDMGTPPDSYAQALDDFFVADNARSQDEYDDRIVTSATGPQVFANRFSWLRSGVHLVGGGSTWATTFQGPADIDDVIYPQGTWFNVSNELGGDDVAVCAEVMTGGSTPVPPMSL